MGSFETLGLADDASPTAVKARYRELVKQQHPDVGGDPAQFQRLTEAYKAALAEATGRPCPSCHGLGQVRRSTGFHVLWLPCDACQ